MKTEFSRLFLKDLDKLTQSSVKQDVAEVIEEVEKASKLSEIKNLKAFLQPIE